MPAWSAAALRERTRPAVGSRKTNRGSMGGKASRVHDGRAASTPAVRAGAAGDDASTAAAGAAPLSRHGSKKLPRNDSRRAEVAVSRSECLHDGTVARMSRCLWFCSERMCRAIAPLLSV